MTNRTVSTNITSNTVVNKQMVDKLNITIKDTVHDNQYSLSWRGYIQDYNALKELVDEINTKVEAGIIWDDLKGYPDLNTALANYVRREISNAQLGYCSKPQLDGEISALKTKISNDISAYDRQVKEFIATNYSTKEQLVNEISRNQQEAENKYLSKSALDLIRKETRELIENKAITRLSQLINDVNAVSAEINANGDTLIIDYI